MLSYVFDTRALIAAERGKERASRFLRLVRSGRARIKDVHAGLTIDAIVMATAALFNAIVVTGDPQDFEKLSAHFPGVSVLAV